MTTVEGSLGKSTGMSIRRRLARLSGSLCWETRMQKVVEEGNCLVDECFKWDRGKTYG